MALSSALFGKGGPPATAQETLALGVLLRQVALFRSLQEGEFQVLVDTLRLHKVNEGEVLFEKGSPGESMLLLTSGRLHVHVEGEGGRKETLELGPGEILGELSFLDPAPRSATVIAATDAHICEFSKQTLRTLQEHAPQVAVAVVSGLISQLTQRLRETNQKIEDLLYQPGVPTISGILPRASLEEQPIKRMAPYKEREHGALDLSPLRSERGLQDRDIEILLSAAPPQVYPDQTVLCSEGALGSTAFLLARGQVEVLRNLAGKNRVLSILGPGAFVGQLALVDRSPRSATVRAKGDVVVMALGRQEFENLLRARSPLAIRFQEQVAVASARQLRSATEHLGAVLGRANSKAKAKGAVPAKPAQATPAKPAQPVILPKEEMALRYIQTTLRELDLAPDRTLPGVNLDALRKQRS